MKRIILILTISMSLSFAGNSQDNTTDTTLIEKGVNDSISSNDTAAAVSNTLFSELEKKAAELMKIRDEEETESFVNEAIEYFNGTKRLENGGPSCISCHTLNNEGIFHGGFLGIDLTNSFTTLNGDNGLLKQLKSPADIRMKITYADNPITDEEMTMLILLLEKADKEKDYQIAGVNRFILFEYGLVGLALIFIIISLLWLKRKKNSVKQDVYDRQIKTT
jgi:hypothetical protein